jgi:hypothetical protein
MTSNMSNPYESPVDCESGLAETRRDKRRWLLAAYVVVGIVISLGSTAATTLVWDRSLRLEELDVSYNWSPSNDLAGMLVLMPVGWMVYSIAHFSGWIFWSGCLAIIVARQRWPLILAGLGGLAFGLYWPEYFVALMGI